MSEAPEPPSPYRVSYAGRVRDELRSLIDRAKRAGRARQVLDAAKRIDYLLHLFPQFGDPLRDLNLDGARLWIGVVAPLVVRYVLDEERRSVFVVTPLLPLRGSGV
jgi:hypothetical protein